MAFTEFVVPTLKTDPETEKKFTTELGPFLVNILTTHTNSPQKIFFGKILLENGNDVSGDFRLCVGLKWGEESHFNSFIDSDNFQEFKTLVKPHSQAPPVPQLYNTDFEPDQVFGATLSETWQVKIGDGDGKVTDAKKAWEEFVSAVAEESGNSGNKQGIQGTSLNLEERRWVGVLGWESSETREKVLASEAVKEAKKALDALVWNTFLTAFQK